MKWPTDLKRRWGMAVHDLLVRLMASPLGTLGAEVIRRVPGLWTKVFLKPALPSQTLADIASLKRDANSCADPARVLFSLALHYLDATGGQADSQALACLRSAQWLGFAAEERILLYQAILRARCGDAQGAQALANLLQPCDLTAQERHALDAAIVLRLPLRQPLYQEPAGHAMPAHLLVVDDPQGHAAAWFPQSAGLFLCPELNGLSLTWCAGLGQHFDLAIGSTRARELAIQAGLSFATWQVVDFAADAS